MNNITFLIFGISGDLARKKLIPALYNLFRTNKLQKCIVVGAAFDDTDISTILSKARPYIQDINEESWQAFSASCYYQKLDFSSLEDFTQLAQQVSRLEEQQNLPGKRVVYCATAAHFFAPITQYLVTVGLVSRDSNTQERWQRIIYEKPFGKNLASAHALNDELAQHVDEKQIYRIDHYLTNEVVGNIALIRFTNCIFEPLWNNRYIDNVQIILSEDSDIGDRGLYYDEYGALRDVVQNHALELLALIAMEAPAQLTGDYIRTERARVLERVKVDDGLLGQYTGYAHERGVTPGSRTETCAALRLMIENTRWAGVPFYIKAGKALDKKETIIHIKFKQVDCLIKVCPSDSNYLTIQVAPDAVFALELNAKKIGSAYEVTPIKMEFSHSSIFGPLAPTAHQVLLEEVVRGDQAVSVRFDEIEFAWKVIDAACAMNLPVYPYKKGTAGPQELADFAKKHGLRWRT